MAQSPIEYQIRENKPNAQPYWWRIVDTRNGKILASSETYYRYQDAVDAAFLVRDNSATAQVVNYTSVKAA